jgi:DNA-binding MarR family transcriptional regulator
MAFSRPRRASSRPSERALAVAGRLNSVAIHLLRRISREDGADGLTGARASALSVVCYRGPLTATELARRERVSAPTISRIVDALVRDGLVRRESSGTDRRAVPLAVTTEGRRRMERGRSRRIQHLATELGGLSRAELDVLDQAIALLERLERDQREREEER